MKVTNPVLSLPTSLGHAREMSAALIERNRGVFGATRMGPDDPPPADPPSDPPADTPAGPPPSEKGFPDGTPLVEMNVEQREAYWKHQSRKHETTAKARADYDAQKSDAEKWRQSQREQMPADQKAIEDARDEAATAARADERGKLTRQLVHARLEGALGARGVKEDQVAGIVGPLDHTYFLTGDGEVDTDKVSAYASGFGGKQQQWPDTGQGKRGGTAPAQGVSAGRDLYENRRKK